MALKRYDRRLAVTITVCLLAAGRVGAEPVDENGIRVEWLCVQEFSERYEVRCLAQATRTRAPMAPLDRHSVPENDPGGRAWDSGPAHSVPVAMRAPDEIFAEGAWKVPLFVRPSDPTAVNDLLQSVLCGERENCSVRYGAEMFVER